jgi:hypothetical protein
MRRNILKIDSPRNRLFEIVPFKMRLLSVVTGCFTAIAGSLLMGPLFAIWPAILILGALVQSKWRHLGRGLMLSGALLLSSWEILFGLAVPQETRTFLQYHDLNSLGVLSLLLASVLLAGWCDVMLVITEIRMRRAQRGIAS